MYPNHPPNQPQQPPVDNNMVMSIVSLLLFWPLGILAIINVSKVNSVLAVGDTAGAQHASAEAKKWSKWAIGAGTTSSVNNY